MRFLAFIQRQLNWGTALKCFSPEDIWIEARSLYVLFFQTKTQVLQYTYIQFYSVNRFAVFDTRTGREISYPKYVYFYNTSYPRAFSHIYLNRASDGCFQPDISAVWHL
jgi:hypothetical protein